MRRARVALACALVAVACARAPAPEYHHNRADYESFRDVYPEVLDPNYLPMMSHLVEVPPGGALARLRRWLDASAPREWRLVLCHWEPADFPLRVLVEPPRFTEALLDERPVRRDPQDYVDAAWRALALWEDALDHAVTFAPARGPVDADLVIRLVGKPAPVTADVQVLGRASLRGSCEATGGDPDHRLEVRFRVHDLRVYAADEHGILLPAQVERLALHEIGHALGMRGHSPIPADLMFEQAHDRLVREGLAASDVNSFLGLYALPSGTVYADPGTAPVQATRAPLGPPRLDLAPHVDVRHGFEAQLPEGWTRVATEYGVAAVDGVPWDYDASLQWNVHAIDGIDTYLTRFGPAHLRGAQVLEDGHGTVGGRPAYRLLLETGEGTRELVTLVESGDGRVAVAIAECGADRWDEYEPWFTTAVGSLELRPAHGELHDRDYLGAGARER